MATRIEIPDGYIDLTIRARLVNIEIFKDGKLIRFSPMTEEEYKDILDQLRQPVGA